MDSLSRASLVFAATALIVCDLSLAGVCSPTELGTWVEKSVWINGDRVFAVGISEEYPNVSDARIDALLRAERELRAYLGVGTQVSLQPNTERTADCSPRTGRFVSYRLISISKTHIESARQPASTSDAAPNPAAGLFFGARYSSSPIKDSTDPLISLTLGYQRNLVSFMAYRVGLEVAVSANKDIRDSDGSGKLLGGGGIQSGIEFKLLGPLFLRPEAGLMWLDLAISGSGSPTHTGFFSGTVGVVTGLAIPMGKGAMGIDLGMRIFRPIGKQVDMDSVNLYWGFDFRF